MKIKEKYLLQFNDGTKVYSSIKLYENKEFCIPGTFVKSLREKIRQRKYAMTALSNQNETQ